MRAKQVQLPALEERPRFGVQWRAASLLVFCLFFIFFLPSHPFINLTIVLKGRLHCNVER